jgi:hypothetical protein
MMQIEEQQLPEGLGSRRRTRGSASLSPARHQYQIRGADP